MDSLIEIIQPEEGRQNNQMLGAIKSCDCTSMRFMKISKGEKHKEKKIVHF